MADTQNNIIKTRVQLKYDTLDSWQKSVFNGTDNTKYLKKGEVAIATLDTQQKDAQGNIVNVPCALIKVGDGATKFDNLPWASALAADVYTWAKCSTVELDGEVIKFHNGDKTKPVHTLDLSKFATDADLGVVNNLTTTAKTAVGAINEHDAEIGDLNSLNTENKTSLVNAINEALQAVEVGGTGSVVTVVKDTNTAETDTYTIKQGGNAVGDKITVGTADLTVEATGALSGSGTFNANATADDTITITHNESGVTAQEYAKNSANVNIGSTTQTGHTTSGSIKVPTIKVDKYGHVTEASEKTYSVDLTHYVTTDTDQTITADKRFDNAAAIFYGPKIYEGSDLEFGNRVTGRGMYLSDGEAGSTEYTVEGIVINKADGSTFNLTFPMHYSEDRGNHEIATLDDVRQIAAGAVDYLGTVASLNNLSTSAGRGDFYRVTAQFSYGSGDNAVTAHVGDLVVAEKNSPLKQLDGTNWTVIHGHEGQIVKVTGEGGLTGGGTSGDVKLSIATGGVTTEKIADKAVTTAKINDAAVTTAKIADAAVTEAKLDTNLATKINNKKDKQTAVTDPTASGKALAFIDTISQNTDGVITVTKKSVNLDSYALKTELPTSSGAATIASISNDVVTLKAGATLNNHTLANSTDSDITLAKIAKTGNVADLVQTANTYIVFDCGSATEVI